MKADMSLPLVPKVRFAEFKDGPRWDLLPLASASDVNPSNDGLPKSFIYIDLDSVKSSVLIKRKEITRDAAPHRAQRLLSHSSPLKKASLTGFHATAKHIAAKAVSPSSETMRTI